MEPPAAGKSRNGGNRRPLSGTGAAAQFSTRPASTATPVCRARSTAAARTSGRVIDIFATDLSL
ncbi:hypothetical protein GCM10009608_58300 [Pseudonocardia alaniniphila]